MKKLSIFFVGSMLCLFASGQVMELKDNWKFTIGDNLKWAEKDYDDSSWKAAIIGKVWEEQGYKGYDGYAWYRLKVIIPSSLREQSTLKDLIKFDLACIDNFDQVYLNGSLIGQNAKTITGTEQAEDFSKSAVSWNTRRIYTLSCKDIHVLWDQENVIAVRVLDTGGNGGICLGIPSISIPGVSDYIKMVVKDLPFSIDRNAKKADKSVRLLNNSEDNVFKGQIHIQSKNPLSGKLILDTLVNLVLAPKSKTDMSFSIRTSFTEYIPIKYTFMEEKSGYSIVIKEYAPYFLTPEEPARPRINASLIYGARPGNTVFIKVPVTGKKPIDIQVTGLPEGLKYDSSIGIITGFVARKGDFILKIRATNKDGVDEKEIKLKIGDLILSTPPMSWNSYYCFWNEVTGEQIRENARLLAESGLINHGYTFYNIDDGWAGKRDIANNIHPNEKFGDMKALGDFIHQKGLKFGIYSSPGPRTCGGFTGSYQYEFQDAKTYGDWGVDYLKYDWCSYDDLGDTKKLTDLKKPYTLMRQALDSVHRDIVYSLCQYGMGDVWKWGRQIGADLWRTTFDIVDSWGSLYSIGFQQYKYSEFAGPGGWNDPDMLQIGWFRGGRELHPSNLTIPEQYSQFTLWALLSVPLMLSCDFSLLDEQTRNIIANDEVIAIDQDPLGKPAKKIVDTGGFQVFVKELENGNMAIGLFNLTEADSSFMVRFSDLGLSHYQNLRDIWKQKDVGVRNGGFLEFLPSHGSVLFFAKNAKKQDLRSYHENWVRYLMADILLGGDKEYYRQFSEDVNSIEAIRRIDEGISIVNLSKYERKMIPGKNIRIVKKGTMEATNSSDIELNTDKILNEPDIRSFMLGLALGKTVLKVHDSKSVQLIEALRRDSVGVKILNLEELRNRGFKSDDKIILSSDVDYDEDVVRYMLADICLGGPAGFYREIYDTWRDPNAGEAVRRWENGVRISNLKRFERKELFFNGTKIVLKGTDHIITGKEVQLEYIIK